MTDEPINLILTRLNRIDENVTRLRDDMRDVKARLTSLEVSVSLLHGDFSGQSNRIDRLEHRLERIENRLNLRDA
ncbi:MAG: hypothetical protein AB7F22_04785 [Reyranella sp.]|uniref:hypothetical protein n=1 Tax=Reyranella sp. TaxID=1929291 RepID=UPI003D14FE8A